MKIFDFENYKAYVTALVSSRPKNGHGEYSRISKSLRIHSTTVSQIFKGDKHLTLDQTHRLAQYLALDTNETDYLMNMVLHEKSESEDLKSVFARRMEELKLKADSLQSKVLPNKELSAPDKAVFYSQWYYSALNLASGRPQGISPDEAAEKLKLPLRTVKEAYKYLKSCGLCREKQGRYYSENIRTHIDRNSPLATRHHSNWRLKSIEGLDHLKKEDLVFTAPITLSKKDAKRVRKEILDLIGSIAKQVEPSPSEDLYCLNIDWTQLAELK